MSLQRRVVLLSRDNGLASIVGLALSNGDRVAQIRSTSELADWSEEAVAMVVLDSRPHLYRQGYKQVRDRYRGPLVMLLDRGEGHPSLPPDGARRYLYRPFSAADVAAALGTPPPKLGTLETAVIDAWSRHAGRDATKRPAGPSYKVGWARSAKRRLRAWAWTVAALMGVLLLFSVGGHSSCGTSCTRLSGVAGAGVAGASESPTPLTSQPPSGAGGASGGGGGTGQAATPPSQPGPGGVPLVSGITGLIQAINTVTAADPTPPAPPAPVPGVPSPAPPPTTMPTPPPTTTPPSTTTPAPTTAPPTSAPVTTAPATTAPVTTEPPSTDPPTTVPPTTLPDTTLPDTTVPPTTQPTITTPATTVEPPTTAPPTT